MVFTELGLSEEAMRGVQALGFIQPTPIQERAIPILLQGKDVIGSAQTGTGKTAAFVLPILSIYKEHKRFPRVLILEPTRELAVQVEAAIRQLGQGSPLRVAVLYGGVGYGLQRDALKTGVDILVATPGRLLDHIQQGTCTLRDVECLVLDEADRMLDMGFMPDVRAIIKKCPAKRQTSLFSATIPPEIDSLIKWAMHEPEIIEIGHRHSPAETVRHQLYPVAERQKFDLLLELLKQTNFESVIVFCRTRDRADRIGQLLKNNKHSVAILHSDRTQKEREAALQGFREGRFELLVATDIASRGLDIAQVTHVVNFDVPQHPEDYVHRIGRTGRAAATGDAMTLMVAEDVRAVESIERFIGQKIERARLAKFNYDYTTVLENEQRIREVLSRPVRGVRVGNSYYIGPAKRKRRR